jgi:hypothetical protein
MTAQPNFEFAPTWLGLFAMLGVGLAFVAFVVVLSVLLASGVHVISSRRIKAIGALMLFVIPAMAVVGMIGMKWGSARAHTYQYYPSAVQTALETNDSKHDSVPVARGETGKMVKPISKVDEATTKAAVIVEVEDTSDEPGRKTDRARSQIASVRALDGANHKDGFPAPSAVQTLVSAPPLAGVLRVRGTASAPPDWAGREPVLGKDGVLVALSSQRFATIGEAEEQVTAQAVECVKKFYRDEYPLPGQWTVPVSVIDQTALSAMVGEMYDQDFGNGVTGKMYRAHLRLNLSPTLQDALHASWHDQVVAHRLKELGGILGLATLALATCAGYFRLDDLTRGQYRRRLKVAAASLIAAGSLVAWQALV